MGGVGLELNAIEQEVQELGKQESMRGTLYAEVDDIKSCLKEVDPYVLERCFTKKELGLYDESHLHTLTAQIASGVATRKRVEQLSNQVRGIPAEVAKETQANIRSLRWWADVAIRASLTTLGFYLVGRFLLNSGAEPESKTVGNPFADISAAAQPRPKPKGRGGSSNVVPLFDRQAY